MRTALIIPVIAAALAAGTVPAQASAAEPSRLLLPGAAFYAESTTAGPDGSLYVSSLGTGEVVRFAPGSSTSHTFVGADVNVGTSGVQADPARGVLWACEVDLSGTTASRLRAFAFRSGAEVQSYVIPGGLCGDIALADESVLVTDSAQGRVFELTTPDPAQAADGTLAVWSADPALAVGAPLRINGIAFDGDRTVYTTNLSTGELFAIGITPSGTAEPARRVPLDTPLTGPDGIRWYGGQLYVTEAAGLSRVSPAAGTRTVVEDDLDQPTSLVFTGSTVFVAEGQVGRFLAGQAPNLPFTVASLPLATVTPTAQELVADLEALTDDVRAYADRGAVTSHVLPRLLDRLDRAVGRASTGNEVSALSYLDQFVARVENQVRNAAARDALVAAAERISTDLQIAEDLENGVVPGQTSHDLTELPAGTTLHKVTATPAEVGGRTALRVELTDAAQNGVVGVDNTDAPTFALIPADFTDGSIEVDVLTRLNGRGPASARGFAGLAYRVTDAADRYESVYLRATNGLKADPPAPRNIRAVQYYAYPDWPFDRLRTEYPDGRYEAGASIGPDEWVTLRIDVDGTRATASINGTPVLAVVGKAATTAGDIGLWVDLGTEAYFSDLTITRR